MLDKPYKRGNILKSEPRITYFTKGLNMTELDLRTLKTAIETENSTFHHGDFKKDLVDAIDELIEAREKLEEVAELATALVTLSGGG